LNVSDSTTQLVTLATCTGLTETEKYNGDITITYRKLTGQLDQISSGSMTGTVAA